MTTTVHDVGKIMSYLFTAWQTSFTLKRHKYNIICFSAIKAKF